MRKYWQQLAIAAAQIFMFYLFPLLAKPLGAMGTVLVMLLAAFVLAMLAGRKMPGKVKILYPVFVAVLFVPSVFLYYNESALVQAAWYLVTASAGVLAGTLLRSK